MIHFRQVIGEDKCLSGTYSFNRVSEDASHILTLPSFPKEEKKVPQGENADVFSLILNDMRGLVMNVIDLKDSYVQHVWSNTAQLKLLSSQLLFFSHQDQTILQRGLHFTQRIVIWTIEKAKAEGSRTNFSDNRKSLKFFKIHKSIFVFIFNSFF